MREQFGDDEEDFKQLAMCCLTESALQEQLDIASNHFPSSLCFVTLTTFATFFTEITESINLKVPQEENQLSEKQRRISAATDLSKLLKFCSSSVKVF